MTTPRPGVARLRQVVERRGGLRAEPGSAYELLTRQMVEQLTRDLAEVRRRVDQLFTTVVGAILLELLLRLWG